MAVGVFSKDPAAILDYSLDWSDWLDGDSILVSTWTIPAGITQVTDTYTGLTSTIRLSGGTHGSDYECLNHVLTASGQEDERSLTIQVRQTEAGASSDATDRAEAYSLLLDWVQILVVPVLESTELENVLDRYQVASTWSPNTFYTAGQRLLPPVRNGYWYQVTQPGTSQSSTRPYSEWPTVLGKVLQDGSSDPQLALKVAGNDSILRAIGSNPASTNVYDVRGAARELWQLKMRKASQFIDTDSIMFNQVFRQCKSMVETFHPINWGGFLA